MVEKISLIKWFFFNACAPWGLFYLIGFILYLFTKNKLVLALTLPGLFFFAIKGMILFSWSRPTSQLSHLIMLLNSFYALYLIFKSRPGKNSIVGLLAGIILLLAFNFFYTKFVSEYRREFEKIMPLGLACWIVAGTVKILVKGKERGAKKEEVTEEKKEAKLVEE